ncbi:MAG: TRAP transporter large permease [Bacteroidetes bacterium]|nr:TRAP transporter large permease [Bacteroidota bacterium]
MEPTTIGYLGFVALVALIFIGVKIFVAAGLVGFFGLMILKDWKVAAGVAGIAPHSEVSNFSLSVLPMFILIGFFAHHGGLVKGAYRFARAWLGWLPGGLAIGTVFATASFGAVSGASSATAAVFSHIAIPEMLKNKYQPAISAAVVAAGGTLASLIPPSAILVIYGIIVEESVGELLLAGFIPGVITAVLYILLLIGMFKLNPELGPSISGISWGERFSSIGGVIPIVAVISIIMGGMYTGWATPTEVGALGAFIVFLIALGRGGLQIGNLRDSLIETVKLSTMIFSVIWGIVTFVRFLGFAGVPAAAAEWVSSLPLSPMAILLVILLMYVLLGMFMNGIGMLLLTLPVIHPVIIELGFDPIWFGIILVKMVEIGLVTPPIGLNCYVVSGVRPDIPIEKIFWAVLPFVLADIAAVALFIIFPEIVTFLPDLVRGR